MAGRIGHRLAVYSAGLWRIRQDLETLTGLQPVRAYRFAPLPRCEAVAGWGHKGTAAYARSIARRRALPYIAFEDGFLRSIRPGRSEPSSSFVLDRVGIYYDAREPSELECLLQEGQLLGPDERARARSAIDLIRQERISKYNSGPDADLSLGPSRRGVLVVDQTFGDASIEGALADATSFERMLEAAKAENPGARIIAKIHPEVVNGSKRGYLLQAAAQGVEVFSEPVNPWVLIDRVEKVYTVSSQLGFDAMLGGREVVCFGMPFYAGWGLTDDRARCERRTRKLDLLDLVHAAFFRYCRYLDAWTRREVDFFGAVEQLAFLRERYLSNSKPVLGYRITAWKRSAVTRMVAGSAQPPRFRHRLDRALAEAKASGADLLAWGGTARRIAAAVGQSGVRLVTVEDGFLRSVGLGASFTPAWSYVFDARGIYYDPSRPSDLETILATREFDEPLKRRARALIDEIVSRGITKYNLQPEVAAIRIPTGREVILLPGQVADDESIRLGAAALSAEAPLAQGGANLALLRRARARNPDAFIIYRPHPDVEARLRVGRIPPEIAREYADHVDTGPSITALMQRADRLETLTSLAGFEALLRGKPVAVHGQPFYAGWGLTEDLDPVARRSRALSLDELVAGTLILYPRYLDPSGKRPCPPEVIVQRLSEISTSPPKVRARLLSIGGRSLARLRHLSRELRRSAAGSGTAV